MQQQGQQGRYRTQSTLRKDPPRLWFPIVPLPPGCPSWARMLTKKMIFPSATNSHRFCSRASFAISSMCRSTFQKKFLLGQTTPWCCWSTTTRRSPPASCPMETSTVRLNIFSSNIQNMLQQAQQMLLRSLEELVETPLVFIFTPFQVNLYLHTRQPNNYNVTWQDIGRSSQADMSSPG